MKNKNEFDYTILIPRLIRGGAELQSIHLANDLINLGKNVSIICFKEVEKNLYPEINNEIKIYELKKKKGIFLSIFSLIKKLYFLLIKIKPRKLILFLSYSEKVYICLRILGLNIKALSFVRAGIKVPSKFHSLYGLIIGSLLEEIYINSESNFIPSLNFYKRMPILIPNHINFDKKIKEKIIDKDKIKIVYIARYITEKNHQFLFKTLSKNIHKDKIELTLIGDSKSENLIYISDLINQYKLNNIVKVLYNVSNVYSILKNIDIMVFCSNYSEGTPNALLEGMACGLKIICSDKFSELAMPINYYKNNSENDFNRILLEIILNKNSYVDKYLEYLKLLVNKRNYILSTKL